MLVSKYEIAGGHNREELLRWLFGGRIYVVLGEGLERVGVGGWRKKCNVLLFLKKRKKKSLSKLS